MKRASHPHQHPVLLGLITTALLLAAFAQPLLGQNDEPVYTGTFSDLAVGGYDPVAYFVDGKPVEGSRDFELRHRGATWRFSSRSNLEAFRAEPDRYAPRYGGFCAWAMAKGDTAPGKPKFWKIVDGQLYLNYNAKVQERWLKDPEGFIDRADGHWPEAAR